MTHLSYHCTIISIYHLTMCSGRVVLMNEFELYILIIVGLFAGKPADYLFLLMFNWLCLVVICLILDFPLLFDPMVMSVLYIWCQLNRDTIVQFWFGTQFKVQKVFYSNLWCIDIMIDSDFYCIQVFCLSNLPMQSQKCGVNMFFICHNSLHVGYFIFILLSSYTLWNDYTILSF